MFRVVFLKDFPWFLCRFSWSEDVVQVLCDLKSADLQKRDVFGAMPAGWPSCWISSRSPVSHLKKNNDKPGALRSRASKKKNQWASNLSFATESALQQVSPSVLAGIVSLPLRASEGEHGCLPRPACDCVGCSVAELKRGSLGENYGEMVKAVSLFTRVFVIVTFGQKRLGMASAGGVFYGKGFYRTKRSPEGFQLQAVHTSCGGCRGWLEFLP